MVNYWLLLGPIGMILVGVIAILYWQRKKKVKISFYIWGSITWLLAITAKALIDFTITPTLYQSIDNLIPSMSLFIIALMVGLRTGFFESGLSYLIFKKRFKKIKWDESIALGIGFGATEAMLLGAMSLLSMIMLMNPLFLKGLTEAEAQMVNTYLDQETLVVFAAWIERAFTLFAHVFATALVVKTLSTGDNKYVWLSIGYKLILDFPIPFFQLIMQKNSLLITYVVELWVIAMGVTGLYGLKWLSQKKKSSKKSGKKPVRKKKKR